MGLSQRRGERQGSAGVCRSLRPLRLGEKKTLEKVSRKGAEDAKAPLGYASLSALSGLARKISLEKVSRKGAGIAKECTIHVRVGTSKGKREKVNVHGQALNLHWLRGTNNFVIQIK